MSVTPKGLPNLGNTCFFNSVMQCLMNTNSVALYLEYLSRMEYVENLHQYSTKIGEKSVQVPTARIFLPASPLPLVSVFKAFLKDFYNNRAPSPNALFSQICRKAPRFRGFAQQDAHELLRYFLDGLRQEEIDRFKKAFSKHVVKEEESGNAKEVNEELVLRYKAYVEGPARPVLDAVFGGVLQQSIKCQNCGFISIRYEPFLDLSLSLQRPKNELLRLPEPVNKKNKEKHDNSKAEDVEEKQTTKQSKHQKKKDQKSKKKQKKLNRKLRSRKESSCTPDDVLKPADTPDSVDSGIIAISQSSPNFVDDIEDAEEVDEETEEVAPSENEEKTEKEVLRCASRLADNDDIIELAQLNNAELESTSLSVINALRLFTMPEMLSASNAYECEKCCAKKKAINGNKAKSFVDASKRYLVSKPPLILTLHLKRFEQIYLHGRMSTKKFRGFVEFGLTLDLAPFCRKSAKCIDANQTEVLYSLYGIVSHSGDLGGGHYIAYVRARPKMESVMQNLFHKSLAFEPDSLSDVIIEKCKGISLNDGENITVDSNGVISDAQNHNNCNGVAVENVNAKLGGREALKSIAENSKWYCVSDSSVQAVSESRVLGVEAYILFYERVY